MSAQQFVSSEQIFLNLQLRKYQLEIQFPEGWDTSKLQFRCAGAQWAWLVTPRASSVWAQTRRVIPVKGTWPGNPLRTHVLPGDLRS